MSQNGNVGGVFLLLAFCVGAMLMEFECWLQFNCVNDTKNYSCLKFIDLDGEMAQDFECCVTFIVCYYMCCIDCQIMIVFFLNDNNKKQ